MHEGTFIAIFFDFNTVAFDFKMLIAFKRVEGNEFDFYS